MDTIRLRSLVEGYYGSQPHPDAPELTMADYEAHERVAWMLHDREPNVSQVRQAHADLRGAGLSPADFERTWRMSRRVANRFLGRDPHIWELLDLKGQHPKEVHAYYRDHPFPGNEEVLAGDVARYMHAAEPIARRFGRKPLPVEAARFAAAGYDGEDLLRHYSGEYERG